VSVLKAATVQSPETAICRSFLGTASCRMSGDLQGTRKLRRRPQGAPRAERHLVVGGGPHVLTENLVVRGELHALKEQLALEGERHRTPRCRRGAPRAERTPRCRRRAARAERTPRCRRRALGLSRRAVCSSARTDAPDVPRRATRELQDRGALAVKGGRTCRGEPYLNLKMPYLNLKMPVTKETVRDKETQWPMRYKHRRT